MDLDELEDRLRALWEKVNAAEELNDRLLFERVMLERKVADLEARLVAADRLAETAQAYLNHSASSDTVNLELEGNLMAALAVYRDNEGSNNE